MIKRMFLFVILILSNSAIYSQTDSIPIGRAIYFQQVDLRVEVPNNGYSTLLFNNTSSVYVQNGAPQSDSSFSSPDFYFPVTVAGDKEGFPIYKHHTDKIIYCKIVCRQSRNHCIVSDTFGAINWVLHPERKRLGIYECRKATGIFRGREYEAWYAVDVPIPSGPFKLGGLPGLILEAQSLDGKVKFLFHGLEMSSNTSGIISVPNGEHLKQSYTAFINGELEFMSNLEKEYRAKGVDISVGREEMIELNEN
jgi:GLPGLI family protein